MELAGWPKPRAVRRALRRIWNKTRVSEGKDENGRATKSQNEFPREALVFVKQQLGAMRCPILDFQQTSNEVSCSRMPLFVLTWLLLKIDFFDKVVRFSINLPTTCDGQINSTRSVASRLDRIIQRKDTVHCRDAHRAAVDGLDKAQRVVSDLWSTPRDKHTVDMINDQVNRTAILHGKLWKCVGSIASLQSCRYRFLNEMADTIEEISAERTLALNTRQEYNFEDVYDSDGHNSVKCDDPGLNAYQMRLLRDESEMVRTLIDSILIPKLTPVVQMFSNHKPNQQCIDFYLCRSFTRQLSIMQQRWQSLKQKLSTIRAFS